MLTEFQVEPQPSALDQNRLAEWLGPNQLCAAIESLLLAQWFRNELTGGEIDLLKVLSGGNTQLLLFRGQRCLNAKPDDRQILDAELTAMMASSDAIFSQRTKLGESDHDENGTIAMARVGTIGPEPIILACPRSGSAPDDPRDSGRFEKLLTTFRMAHQSATELASKVREKYSPDQPGMIIHGTSGRIIVCNQKMANLINAEAGDILDREYSMIAASLMANPVRFRIRLENLSLNGSRLTVLATEPLKNPRPTPEKDKFFSEFFFHSFRNHLCGIMAAASHLQVLAGERESDGEQELTEIILGEAASLDRHLNQLSLLTGRMMESPAPLAVASGIADALDGVCLEADHQFEVNTADLPPDGAVSIPALTLTCLIEAVLRSHLKRSVPASVSKIIARPAGRFINITIETHAESSAGTPLTLDRPWQTLARLLSDRYGFQCPTSEATEGKGLITQINLPAASIRGDHEKE